MDDKGDFDTLRDSLGIERAEPSDALRRMLAARSIPADAQEMLFRLLMAEPLDLEVTLFPEDGVRGCNSDEFCPILLRDGLIAVGWSANGDLVAIDLIHSVGTVGFVCHETMWQTGNVRKVFHPVAASFAEFVALSELGRMPIDYHEALRRFPA